MASDEALGALERAHTKLHPKPKLSWRVHLLDLPLELILPHLGLALGQLACTCRCSQMLPQLVGFEPLAVCAALRKHPLTTLPVTFLQNPVTPDLTYVVCCSASSSLQTCQEAVSAEDKGASSPQSHGPPRPKGFQA